MRGTNRKNPSAKTFATFYLNFSPKNAHNSAVQHLPKYVNVGIHSFLCGKTFHTKKTARNWLIKKFLCKNILHRRKNSGGKNDNFWKVYEPQTTKNKSSFIKVYGELLFFSFLPGLHIKTIFHSRSSHFTFGSDCNVRNVVDCRPSQGCQAQPLPGALFRGCGNTLVRGTPRKWALCRSFSRIRMVREFVRNLHTNAISRRTALTTAATPYQPNLSSRIEEKSTGAFAEPDFRVASLQSHQDCVKQKKKIGKETKTGTLASYLRNTQFSAWKCLLVRLYPLHQPRSCEHLEFRLFSHQLGWVQFHKWIQNKAFWELFPSSNFPGRSGDVTYTILSVACSLLSSALLLSGALWDIIWSLSKFLALDELPPLDIEVSPVQNSKKKVDW